MNKKLLIACTTMLVAFTATSAHAQRIGGARENIAGGVTAGGAHDVRGPCGGRAVGEGGAVADGDGAGLAGSRGCARTGAGGRGCGAGATWWDEDANLYHEQSGYARGAFGNTASTQGSFERDGDGDVSGRRESEVNIANRSYSLSSSFDSSSGWERDVECSGSGCRD